MTLPAITIELSFDDVSDTTPTYTDVTTYAESFSVTRGRNHELARIDASTATVRFTDFEGRFTPGKAGSPYNPNVVPRRRLRITAVWSAVTYRLFTGYIEKWAVTPSGNPNRLADVVVTAVDAFKILSGVRLFAAYAEQIFTDLPDTYLPLTDPPGSTSASNFGVTPSVKTVPLLRSKNGTAASDFGADKVIKFGDVGTSLGLNPASTAVKADMLDCTYVSDAFPTFGSVWTFESWVTYKDVPGGNHYLMRHQSKHGTGINGFAITIHTDGTVNVSTGSAVDVISNSTSIVDSTPHHIALVYTTGGANGTIQLWIDGVQVASNALAASMFPFGEQADPSNTFCCVGGVHYASNVQDGGVRANLGHVAFYGDDLTSGQIAAHYDAGFAGSPEDENTRIGLLLDFAGWSATDRDLEAAVTTLGPRDWADPTPSVNALSDAAFAAGGAFFLAGDNKATYQNRQHRYNRPADQAFSAADDAPESEGTNFAHDDAEIRNDIDASRAGNGGFNVKSQASINKYGAIQYTLSLAVTTDDEVNDAANWLLYLYADPKPRVPALTWNPTTASTNLYPKLLPLEFGDRITVANLPATMPDGPLDVFVEQITHAVSDSEWKTTLQLSPATPYDVSTVGTGKVESGSPLLIVAY